MKTVKVVLRNPIKKSQLVDYTIEAYDTELANDWLVKLKEDIVKPKLSLEKNYCFLGFPYTHRDLDYLCKELNDHIYEINMFNRTNRWQDAGLEPYIIEEWFSPDVVRFDDSRYPISSQMTISDSYDPVHYQGMRIKHDIMNVLHNHFERMQGTVWAPSKYYELASPRVKSAIRNLNMLCHEMESLILSQRKLIQAPDWVRPSQITTFLSCPRHELKDSHRTFDGTYDRRFGEVYMHWAQIGKTLMEVYADEGAPDLTVGDDPTDISVGEGVTCEAINALKYYSGEFDIEWAKDVTYSSESPWHIEHMDGFNEWLTRNGIDHTNQNLSLGYLPMAHVNLKSSFGTEDMHEIWKILGDHLDIYQIEVDGETATFDYCWSDDNYHNEQIKLLK
jgi:hypothetical protein